MPDSMEEPLTCCACRVVQGPLTSSRRLDWLLSHSPVSKRARRGGTSPLALIGRVEGCCAVVDTAGQATRTPCTRASTLVDGWCWRAGSCRRCSQPTMCGVWSFDCGVVRATAASAPPLVFVLQRRSGCYRFVACALVLDSDRSVRAPLCALNPQYDCPPDVSSGAGWVWRVGVLRPVGPQRVSRCY